MLKVGTLIKAGVIAMVLPGGVSIFSGKGSMLGVLLSILIVLNLRNGMLLLNITGHIQTAVVGILLIASVLVLNLIEHVRLVGAAQAKASTG
jgi:rhamnose transport system permease protein